MDPAKEPAAYRLELASGLQAREEMIPFCPRLLLLSCVLCLQM